MHPKLFISIKIFVILKRLTAVGLTAGGAARYKYDASGARYEKTVGGVTTSYHLIDGVAYGEKRSDGVELQYLYDENGRVYGLRKGGILYYFLFNGQGDVIGIVDEYETLQCRYAYDAWGKVLSVKDASGAAITNATHIGNLNPFRYRGYYYDVETGFYYLNSRYYDPTVKRFLTMDCQLGANGDVAALNMYAYCGNNPVAREDSYGTSWDDIKAFGDGLKDGFTGFFTDAADAIQNLPNTISDAVGYIKDDPVGALTSGLKASVSNILDPFGGRQKIYNFGKSLLDGDAYGAGHIAGGHAAESAVAIASYGAGKGISAAANKVMPKVLKSKVFNINEGYGFKKGNFEFLYREPTVKGGTFVSYKSATAKWRISWDTIHGFHYHFGFGAAGRRHRGLFRDK